MKFCSNCGASISEAQFMNFNGLCPECVRISNIKAGIIKNNSQIQGYPCICLGFLVLIITLVISLNVSQSLLERAIAVPIIGTIVGIAFIFIGCVMYKGSTQK
ncbi:hypothetical protein ES705_47369 [subsurface metagenome]